MKLSKNTKAYLNQLKDSAIHGLIVAAHIVAAMAVAAVIKYLVTGHDQIVVFLTQYGIPVGISNVVIAAVLDFIKNHPFTKKSDSRE